MTRMPISRRVLELQGYQPGEQRSGGDYLKLNTNENPYPPSPAVADAVARAASEGLQLYPAPLADELRARAAERYGLSPAQVLVGNGSDDILNLCVRATVDHGQAVAYTVPSYSLYRTLVLLAGGRPVEVAALPGTLPRSLGEQNAALYFLCSPNAPFGTPLAVDQISDLLLRTDALVIADEAYIDFGGDSALPLLAEHRNLIVSRSFSKSFSLAGARIGLAFGDPALLEQLAKVKDSYNVSRLSIAAGCAALEDYEWMQRNVARVCATRDRVTVALHQLGYEVAESAANFVWMRRAEADGRRLYEELRTRGILVRFFDVDGLREGVRVTIGTDATMDRFLTAVQGLELG